MSSLKRLNLQPYYVSILEHTLGGGVALGKEQAKYDRAILSKATY